MMGSRIIGAIQSLIRSGKGKISVTNSRLLSSQSSGGLGLGLYTHLIHTVTNNDLVAGFDNLEIVTSLNDAMIMFYNMIETRPLPSLVNFTKLMDFVTSMNYYYPEICMFEQMRAIDVPFDIYTANIVIKCYCRAYNTEQGLAVLGSFFKQGISSDVSTHNTILDGFILEDKTHEAETLFRKLIKNKLCEPNIVTYNTMIKGLCKIGNNYTAIALLRLMNGRGCTPDIVSYNTIIHSLCNDLMIDDAIKLFHEMLFHKDILHNSDTYNSLIYALSMLGRWDQVCLTLKDMGDPNVKTFNILVDAFCKQGKVKEAQDVYDNLVISEYYTPDIMTYNSLINGYCLQDEISKAWKVFDDMVFRGVEYNADTFNTFLDWYTKHPMCNVKTFNILVDAFCKQDDVNEEKIVNEIIDSNGIYLQDMMRSVTDGLKDEIRKAKTVFKDECDDDPLKMHWDWYTKHMMLCEFNHMFRTKSRMPKFNNVSEFLESRIQTYEGKWKSIDEMETQVKYSAESNYKSFLKDFCDDNVDKALNMFRFMKGIGNKLNSNIDVYNILIDGAVKSGRLDIARCLFHDLFGKGLQPDIETYRAMISSFCVQGLLKDAKQLFYKMEKSDCPSNNVIINDLIKGYSENKPSDNVAMLLRELERKGFGKIMEQYHA